MRHTPRPWGVWGLVLGQNLKAGRGKHSSHGYWRQLKVDAVGGVDLVKRAWVAPSWRHAWRCVDSHNSGWNSEFAASWSSKTFACLRSGVSSISILRASRPKPPRRSKHRRNGREPCFVQSPQSWSIVVIFWRLNYCCVGMLSAERPFCIP